MANMGFPAGGLANQGWKLYLTSLIMILFAGLFVIIRIATRIRTGKLGADDYTIVFSLAVSTVLCVNIQLAIVHGYGQHQKDLSTQQLRTCLKFFWIAQTPYKIVVCLNKTSVVLLYKRIFISKSFQLLCWSALAIIISSGIATTFATILQCIPTERSWNKKIPGTCIDNTKFWLANAVINIATDVIVLALPIREVFKLHLKKQEKVMLLGVFMLGGFVTITSILRVTAVANSVRNQADQTWNFIPRGIWTLIEANLGIICTCLPVLKQLIKRVFPSMFGTTKATPNSNGYGYGYGSTNPESRRDRLSRLPNRTDDEESIYKERVEKGPWSGSAGNKHRSYRMSTLAYGRMPSPAEESRKSDEKHIMSAKDLNLSAADGKSVEGNDSYRSAWSTDHPGSGITITRTVDVHVADSKPSSRG